MANLMMLALALAVGLTAHAATAQTSEPPDSGPRPQGARLDLTGPFHTRTPWRLDVSEGPPTKDYGDNDAPGALTLCLHRGPDGPCVSAPVTVPLRATPPDDPIAWEPHYLLTARPVWPRGPKAAPLLLIVTGSLNSGDGDQLVTTQLVRYDAARDGFRRVYARTTGHNMNEEVRFVRAGPLRGAVISAEPQSRRPFGYWIVVSQPTPGGDYRQVLRFGSATRYNDGNPLAVIDSEMPGIERRLGLWKPGAPLPAPRLMGDGKPCLSPKLKHGELWCG